MTQRANHLLISDSRVQFFTEHPTIVLAFGTIEINQQYIVGWNSLLKKPYGLKQNAKYTIEKLYTEAGNESFVKFKGYTLVIPIADLFFNPVTK